MVEGEGEGPPAVLTEPSPELESPPPLVGAVPDFVVVPPLEPSVAVVVLFPPDGARVVLFGEPVGTLVDVLTPPTVGGETIVGKEEGPVVPVQVGQVVLEVSVVVVPPAPVLHPPTAVHVVVLTLLAVLVVTVTDTDDDDELVTGRDCCAATIPTIEASVINFARILEVRIFYLIFLYSPFYSERGGISIDQSCSRGGKKEKKCRKKEKRE